MPTYEYVCANGHRTEVMHGIYAPGPEKCPICGAPVRKAFLAPSVHFKGSGWAKMDRRPSGGSRKTDDEAAVPLSRATRNRIAEIKRQERRLGCSD